MPFQLVVVGASQGGLHALEVILPSLPKQLPMALVIAQHRYSFAADHLATYLRQLSPLPMVEVEDKLALAPGQAYLAPADYHVLIEPGHFALSTEAPVAHARPSINVLFESAADAYGRQVVGLILTGASHDGAQGLSKICACGGLALVQDPATAESQTMPKAAIAAVPTAHVVPLSEIAPLLVNVARAAQSPQALSPP